MLLKELSDTIKEVKILQKSEFNISIIDLFGKIGDAVDRQSFSSVTKGISLMTKIESLSQLNNIYVSILIDLALEKGIELFIASKFTFRLIFSPKSEVIYKHVKFWQKSLRSIGGSLKILKNQYKLVHIVPPS